MELHDSSYLLADLGIRIPAEHVAHNRVRAWQAVISMLDAEVVPLLRKCSLAGHAEYKTHNEASTEPQPQTATAC